MSEEITETSMEEHGKKLDRLKYLYFINKRFYEPDIKHITKHWDYIWPKLLQLLAERDIVDFEAYIHAQFKSEGRATQPTHLLGRFAVERYERYREQAHDCLKLRLQLQADKVKSRLRYRTLRETLLDRDEELTPLFRACIANESGLADVCEEFETEAAYQYILNPRLYDDVYGGFGDVIPEFVKCKAHIE